VDIPLNKYLSSQKESDLIKSANWKIIFSYCNNMDSKEFKYFFSHQPEFVRYHGQDSVNNKIYNVFIKTLTDLSRSEIMGDSAYSRRKREILSSGYAGTGKVVFDADLNLFYMQGNLTKAMDLAFQELDRYYSDDPAMLENIASLVHTISKDKKYLEKGLQWSKRSVELKPDITNNSMYAALLYDLGKQDDAVKYCKIALELARKQNGSTTKIEENLKKYESGK
jgi:tetratricopeptide (TPR) repeat protein